MVYTTVALKFGSYFQGDFFYRVNRRCRKILPTLTQKIQDLFDYAG